tara:strand:- start:780 stop:1082 length:303 start_codon:yes stop_codon:yes gene_type:complete
MPELSKSQMDKLKEHSKKHGGMGSKHMRMMKKMMKDGASFSKAHSETMKMEKKEKKPDREKKEKPMRKKKEEGGLTAKQKKLPEKLKKAIAKKNMSKSSY